MSTPKNTPDHAPDNTPTPGDADDITAENAAAVLAADETDAAESSKTSRLTRRRLLTVGGLAAAAVVGGGAWLTLRRTNSGVVGAAEKLPLVIGGDICAAPLYAAYHQGYFDDAGLNVTLARTSAPRTPRTPSAPGSTSAPPASSSPGWSPSTTASTPS